MSNRKPTQPVSTERLHWLVRHAESAANAGAVTDDPGSIPLSPRGEVQAEALAARLPRRPDLIVHSPFVRTHATALPTIARYPGVPVEVWPIQEFTYLSPARCAATSAAQRRPMVEAYWQRCDPSWVDAEDAESFSAMLGRVRALRERLSASAHDFIAVFAHGQIMQALRLLEDMPAADDQTLMARFVAYDRAHPIGNAEIIELGQNVPAV